MLGGLAPATAYPAKEPWPSGPMVLPIGDVHAGKVTGSAVWQANMNRSAFDLARRPTPPVVVQIGDLINGNATAATQTQQVSDAKAWFDPLPGTVKRVLGGNHDAKFQWDMTAAMAAFGYNGLTWTYDPGAGYPLLIGVSPTAIPADATTIDITDQLAWLDATLTAATKPCWIFCHAELGDDTIDAADPMFRIQPHASVLALLDAHSNAKAWISGHTHPDPFTYNTAYSYTLPGGRKMAWVNVGALAYLNPGDDLYDPALLYPLWPKTGRIDVRMLDCGMGAFRPWSDGAMVRSVAFD